MNFYYWQSSINYYFTFNSFTSWIYLFTLFVYWFNDLKIQADRKLEKPSPSLCPNSFSPMIGGTFLILLTFFSPRLQLHEESDSEMLLIREEFLITRFVFATMEKRVKSSWKWNRRGKYPRKNEAHKKVMDDNVIQYDQVNHNLPVASSLFHLTFICVCRFA